MTAQYQESADIAPSYENSFWRFLAEHGTRLADKHRDEHPLIEPHDPLVGKLTSMARSFVVLIPLSVCRVESEFESELDVDLTDPQWSLVAPDCRFKPILDFLEHAPLEPPVDPRGYWITTAVLGELCGHCQASGPSGSITWKEHYPNERIVYDECDCVLVPSHVNLKPPPPEMKLQCKCDFCRESTSKWYV